MTVVEPVGSVRWKYVVIAAVALAFALKVAVAFNTYGSNDVITWERHLAKIKNDGGAAWYRDGADILGPDGRRLGVQSANHPPLVIHMLLAWDCLARLTGLPFRFWLRLTSSLADIGSLILVSICLIGAGMPVQPGAMLLIALSPVSIMVSAFHGNTDPVMMFFVLLSIWVVQREGPAWVSGAAIGVALSIKIVPIIFAPAFLLYLPAMRRRIEFTVATAAVFMGTSLPYLTQDPALLVQRIFGYSSTPAAWGVSPDGFCFPAERGVRPLHGGWEGDCGSHHSANFLLDEPGRPQTSPFSAVRMHCVSLPFLHPRLCSAILGMAGPMGLQSEVQASSVLLCNECGLPVRMLYVVVGGISLVPCKFIREARVFLVGVPGILPRPDVLGLGRRGRP